MVLFVNPVGVVAWLMCSRSPSRLKHIYLQAVGTVEEVISIG